MTTHDWREALAAYLARKAEREARGVTDGSIVPATLCPDAIGPTP